MLLAKVLESSRLRKVQVVVAVLITSFFLFGLISFPALSLDVWNEARADSEDSGWGVYNNDSAEAFNYRLYWCKYVDSVCPAYAPMRSIRVSDSGSMGNVFDHTDTILVYTPLSVDEISVCDIIIYEEPGGGAVIHRVNKVYDNGTYLMSGDTNWAYDLYRPTFDNVTAKYCGGMRK
ncbi:hypothetical protein LCGC14_0484910 [marine sediment metagenome]|uniref:Uncharacterized protein n=1 Tax=marine sediment metagenome TaxID=412755 RepID=A0A0F9VH15_9ZZZZ